MQKYTNIIFDLDGTLTNPYEGIYNSLLYTIRKMGIGDIPLAVPHNFIGPPLQQSFSDLYGLNEQNTELAVQYYREYYQKHGLYENTPYPGIAELLFELSSRGKRLFIATSKHHEIAWEIIQYFELDKYFEDLEGADGAGNHTKGSLIINLIDKYRLDRKETLMIGDTHFDMQGAKDAEIDVVACGYGFGKEEELRSFNPVAFVEDVEDLVEILL
jgi:phosphoglycolate phosphatase